MTSSRPFWTSSCTVAIKTLRNSRKKKVWMGPERRRGSSFSLTNYFLLILLLCFVSLLINYRSTRAGNRPLSVLENFLQESIASSDHKKAKRAHAPLNIGRFHNAKNAREAVMQKNHESKSPLAGLNCDAHGGPSEDIAKEMIYWEDIPSDSRHVSPFKKQGVTQYLTFEPDVAGWNNIRMSMETVVALAVAMGRTLVLPPKENYFYNEATDFENPDYKFSLSYFFPFDYVGLEHVGVEIITTQEFLERMALTGNLRDKHGNTSFPPNNVTKWDDVGNLDPLRRWLRSVTHMTLWSPDECLAVFPSSTDPKDIEALQEVISSINKTGGFPSYKRYLGKAVPLNASVAERMKEMWANREYLCIYDEHMQKAPVVHFPYDDNIPGARLLVHFYAFLFFQDWRQDLWMKRFVRDHIRYVDKFQCAAARIVNAIRARARANGDPNGNFDSFHIRRDDFMSFANDTKFSAEEIYEVIKDELVENATIYIATDEKNRSYFDPLRKHYDLVFLTDFQELLADQNTMFYGLIEQLVVSRGRAFFGTYYSTFSGYINRLRGYHANRLKSPGYEQGIIRSWYFAPEDTYDAMRTYYPVLSDFYVREYPTSWRLIDTGVEAMKNGTQQMQW